MRFADIKNDIAFKKVFGDMSKKEILISFLNAVLDFQDNKKIVDVTILNPYQAPKIEDLKETILDIKATNQDKENFIVEMQKKDLGDFAKRSLYYTSKAYISQLEKGNNYSKLKKVYFIGILNFKVFDSQNYISRHLILNQETMKQDLSDFEFSFIELPKFKLKLKDLKTTLDKWIFFIKNAQKLDLIPKEFETIDEFREAFEIATQYKWTKKELEIYDYISLKEMDEQNAIETAKKKMEIAIKEAVEKAEVKAKAEGKTEGEKQKAIEIAKNLLLVKVDINLISQSTGLSVDEIEELKV